MMGPPSPHFSKFPVYFYGYDDIEVFCLSKREQLVRERVGLILGVLRGGGVPALMLSQMLGVPVDFVHYDRREARARIKNEEVFDLIAACAKEGKSILLVEDIAGAGRTLINCCDYLRSVVRDDLLLKVLVLVHHENSRVKPDYYKDCTGVRAILPWERYVTGGVCVDDFARSGEALMDDQRYKKIVAINDRSAPLNLRCEWVVDCHLDFDGNYDLMLDAIKKIGPEEVYCGDDLLIGLILAQFPFVVLYKVIDKNRYRVSAVD